MFYYFGFIFILAAASTSGEDVIQPLPPNQLLSKDYPTTNNELINPEGPVVIGYEPVYVYIDENLTENTAEPLPTNAILTDSIKKIENSEDQAPDDDYLTTVPASTEPTNTGLKGTEESVIVGYEPVYEYIDIASTDKILQSSPLTQLPPKVDYPTTVPTSESEATTVIGEIVQGVDSTDVTSRTLLIAPFPITENANEESKGKRVVVGYKPIYGRLESNSNTKFEPRPSEALNFKCPKQFGYYRFGQSCDNYIECQDFKPSRKVCTNGQHFKLNPSWSESPCAYPSGAECLVPQRPKTPIVPNVPAINFPPTAAPALINLNNEETKVSGKPVIVGYKPIYGRLNVTDFKCPKRFGYYRYEQSCDSYIKCSDYKSSRNKCPNGMHFKVNPRWTDAPCAYPLGYECLVHNELPVIEPNQFPAEDNTNSLEWDFKCPKRFGYYRFRQSCDLYVECRNFRPTRKVCPDGMHFKEKAPWSEYPCAYPPEAQCLNRDGALPARPTAECPHQFGFYPISDTARFAEYNPCTSYIACSAGVAHVMNCTFGLVFNPAMSLCDWPENVPACKDVFEFRCPLSRIGEEDVVFNYRYPNDPECRYFYSCLSGSYRLLSCDEGLVFDHRIGRCVEYDDNDGFVCDYNKYPYTVDQITPELQ